MKWNPVKIFYFPFCVILLNLYHLPIATFFRIYNIYTYVGITETLKELWSVYSSFMDFWLISYWCSSFYIIESQWLSNKCLFFLEWWWWWWWFCDGDDKYAYACPFSGWSLCIMWIYIFLFSFVWCHNGVCQWKMATWYIPWWMKFLTSKSILVISGKHIKLSVFLVPWISA